MTKYIRLYSQYDQIRYYSQYDQIRYYSQYDKMRLYFQRRVWTLTSSAMTTHDALHLS